MHKQQVSLEIYKYSKQQIYLGNPQITPFHTLGEILWLAY
jgi:hypothetical protein